MSLQIRRGTNKERLGVTLVQGEVVYVTDHAMTSISVTALNATTNQLTTTLSHGLSVNQQIKYLGESMNGLTNEAVYFVKTVDSIYSFTLSATQGGTVTDISGTWTVALQFATGPTDVAGTPIGSSITPLYAGDGQTVGGVPAGSVILDELQDVEIGTYGNVGQYGTALANNQLLQYNSITQRWENRNDLTLNGNLYVNGDNLYLNYDSTATNSTIYFKGAGQPLRYNNSSDFFEVDNNFAIGGLQVFTSGGITAAAGNLTLNSTGTVEIQKPVSVLGSVSATGIITTTAESLHLNSDSTATDVYVNFKGVSEYIKYANSSDFFEFSANIARGQTFLSDGALHASGGNLTLSSAGDVIINSTNNQTTIQDNATITGNLIVSGDLTVNGTTTSIDTANLVIEDNMIVLNKNQTGTGGVTAGFAGIEVERGDLANAVWQFNEANDWWEPAGATNSIWASNWITAGLGLATNGDELIFNNADGAALTAKITVKRGVDADVLLRWNETNDRWESTTNGTTFIALPNQALDTTSGPTFATLGVTGAATFYDNLSVSGSSLLGNAPSDTTQVTGSFSVNSNDLYVQQSTGFVGINDNTPSYQLDVAGDLRATLLRTNSIYRDTQASPSISLDPTGNVTVELTLTVDGVTTLNDSVNITAGTFTSDATDNLFNNGVRLGGSSGDSVRIYGTTTVYSPVNIQSTVTTNSQITSTADITASTLTIDSRASFETNLTTTTATTATMIAQTLRDVFKAVVHVEDTVSGAVHCCEALVMRNGASALVTVYGELRSAGALATFTADVDAGYIRLLATPASTNSTTFNVVRLSLD